MDSIFESSKKVKAYILNQMKKTNTVMKTGVVAIKGDDILVFNSVGQARNSAPDGHIFSYIYHSGDVELRPEN